MAAFGQTDLAQSFEQSASDIDGAAIFLFLGAGDDAATTITIQLWNALPNAGGSELTSGSVGLTGSGQWAQVSWADYGITANTTYYLVLLSTDNTYEVSGDVTGAYDARGHVYANAGYGSFPNYDYTFETFAAAPEPISCGLLGFGAIALLRRRRANSKV